MSAFLNPPQSSSNSNSNGGGGGERSAAGSGEKMVVSESPVPGSIPVIHPHPSDDGTERVETDVDEVFIRWLEDNGARFPKVVWPSRATVGGVRGAVATGDIATNEPMMWIPHKLLISPPVARSSPHIGHVFIENERFFHGDDDLLLATYCMYEESRGKDSFWYPFLAMLPRPGSISDWTKEEMAEVQDDVLVHEAKRRPQRLNLKYERLMVMLEEEYFDLFDRTVHTFERFRHAWMTIQARAFGRRLPWTALVPFADCLNHTNVQTKYDFNVDDNGMFRLYPTGRNCYPKGAEVFNSYGRRDNSFLLMEYGFALHQNEWDTVDMTISIEDTDVACERKRSLLKRFYISSTRRFKLRLGRLNSDLLSFCRLRTMTDEELDEPDNEVKFFGQGISFPNEVAALNMYMAVLEDKQCSYPTSFEEDAELLDAAGTPPRLVAAARYRHSKKRILRNQIEILVALKPLVQLLHKQEGMGLLNVDTRAARMKSLTKYIDAMVAMANPVKPEPLGMPNPAAVLARAADSQQTAKSRVGAQGGTAHEAQARADRAAEMRPRQLVQGRHVVSVSAQEEKAGGEGQAGVAAGLEGLRLDVAPKQNGEASAPVEISEEDDNEESS